MGGQVRLPGGSHCSPASRCPLPQTAGVVVVVVVAPAVPVVLVVVVVEVTVVVVARHSLSSVRVQLSRQRTKAPPVLSVKAPVALLPQGTSPSQTSLHSRMPFPHVLTQGGKERTVMRSVLITRAMKFPNNCAAYRTRSIERGAQSWPKTCARGGMVMVLSWPRVRPRWMMRIFFALTSLPPVPVKLMPPSSSSPDTKTCAAESKRRSALRPMRRLQKK